MRRGRGEQCGGGWSGGPDFLVYAENRLRRFGPQNEPHEFGHETICDALSRHEQSFGFKFASRSEFWQISVVSSPRNTFS